MLDRRSLLGSLIAGLCGLLARPAAAFTRRELPPLKMGEDQLDRSVSTKDLRLKSAVERKNDQLFLIACGGSFPNQHITSMRPVTGGVESENAPNSPHAVLEQAAQYPKDYDPTTHVLYPRSPRFRVMPEILIGTIDQLASAWAARLRLASEAMMIQPSPLGYGTPEQQAKLREVYEIYKRDDGAASVPFDHDGRCAAAEAERKRLDNAVPTMPLKITPEQWVWLAHNYPMVAATFLAYRVDSVRVTARSTGRVKLKWDILFEARDNVHFMSADDGVCLVLDNPCPWSENAETVFAERAKPGEDGVTFNPDGGVTLKAGHNIVLTTEPGGRYRVTAVD